MINCEHKTSSHVWYTKTINVPSHQMYNHQLQTHNELVMKIILLSEKGSKFMGFDLLSGNKRHEDSI
jgi:hypothetical protein